MMFIPIAERWEALALFGLMLFSLIGCGRSSGLESRVVNGMLTCERQPIEDGEIRFVPTDDTEGPTSAASIHDGRYEVTARGGVPVGTHRVEIRAFRVAHGAKPLEDRPGMHRGELPKEQYLPKQYNEQSELRVVVEPGRGATSKDFDLGATEK